MRGRRRPGTAADATDRTIVGAVVVLACLTGTVSCRSGGVDLETVTDELDELEQAAWSLHTVGVPMWWRLP